MKYKQYNHSHECVRAYVTKLERCKKCRQSALLALLTAVTFRPTQKLKIVNMISPFTNVFNLSLNSGLMIFGDSGATKQ